MKIFFFQLLVLRRSIFPAIAISTTKALPLIKTILIFYPVEPAVFLVCFKMEEVGLPLKKGLSLIATAMNYYCFIKRCGQIHILDSK